MQLSVIKANGTTEEYLHTNRICAYVPACAVGIDAGVMTVDRGEDEFPWLTFPADPSAELTGPTCGLHWPNMLHPDPEKNPEIVARWINFLKPYNEKEDMMLAPDSVAFQHQLAHHTLTLVKPISNSIEVDFTETDKLPGNIGIGELTIKIITDKPYQFRSEGLEIKSQSLQGGSEFLYVLNLKRLKGKVKPRIFLI